MYAMGFDITLGRYRLTAVEKITVRRSVENLSDTAEIVLPGTENNRALRIEEQLAEGDRVVIRFGYDTDPARLPVEFEGYIAGIATDDGPIRITCEDELYGLRRELRDAVLTDTTLQALVEHIAAEAGGYAVWCDYDYRFDQFTIRETTACEVLKKIQEETRADIYLDGRTLHVHPQYSQTGRQVVYDFAVNIEQSALKYRGGQGKFQVVVEGTDAAGKSLRAVRGEAGGDRTTIRLPGVQTLPALEKRAEEELKTHAYAGYEGDFTGWLLPQTRPTDIAVLRDADYQYKNGSYYVVAVETTFAAEGGSRKITLGKKVS